MAWLKQMRRELKLKRKQMRRRVNPTELLERYGLGKPIHYTECWNCKLFYRYEQCPYRYWLRDRLFCVRKAKEIDSRLVIGLRSDLIV